VAAGTSVGAPADLLAQLRTDRSAYVARLAAKLNIAEDRVRELGDELVEAGDGEWVGYTKRAIRRLHDSDADPSRSDGDHAQASEPHANTASADGAHDDGEPRALKRVAPLAQKLWRALPADGEMATNVEIRSRDEFSEVDGGDLQEARRELKRHGLVELRSGRDGGGVRRIELSAPPSAPRGKRPPPSRRTTALQRGLSTSSTNHSRTG
jgi:hypothetical protein